MSWHVSLHPHPPLIQVHVAGHLTPDELFSVIHQILVFARQHASPRVLVDCSQLRGAAPMSELYTLAHALTLSDPAGTLRQAILCSDAAAQTRAAQPWHRAWESPDHTVRIFEDPASALAWLFADHGASPPAPPDRPQTNSRT